MENDQTRAAFNAAVEEAKLAPATRLPILIQHTYGIPLNDKGFAAECPWCQKKDRFNVNEKKGDWLWGCYNNTCHANSGGDSIKWIMAREGIDRKAACKRLLEIAGIPNPFDVRREERRRAATASPKEPVPERSDSQPPEEPAEDLAMAAAAATPEGAAAPWYAGPSEEPAEQEPEDFFGDSTLSAAPVKPLDAADLELEEEPDIEEDESAVPTLIEIPRNGRNAYEAAWSLMTLSDEHFREIRAKRGMPDPWIVALGLRTACAANAELLAPILDQFPPNELLRSGIAERDSRTRSLKISSVLCGREYDEDSGKWVNRDNIIIPYVDALGRIILLRPHKKSLSNGRWREREAVAEFYEKLHNNLRKFYGEVFLLRRSADWGKTCVICEGEFKAMALRMLGIPAIAFQGIHFFRQNWEYKKAIDDTADMLRKHGILEVIVVFDNESKEHKKPEERFEAELYARYTAECMEDRGFKALWGMLPDEWQEDGKADWDSRLSWHVREAGFERGFSKARNEFHKLLNDRPRKGAPKGTVFAIRTVQRQVEFMNFKEDVINQLLHKLRHEPEIFEGGKHELELAAELRNFCHPKYKHKLRIDPLCDELRGCLGGYYKPKAPGEKMQDTCADIIEELKSLIDDLENTPGRSDDEDLELRQYRAARQACYTILYRYPKVFTDFTAESHYKVLVTEMDGSLRWDRLITFRDRHGVRSRPWQLPAKMMRSSQELRSFFLGAGCYHWSGNQDECDMFAKHIDVKNYQRGIEEIDTYGWNKEGKFYLLGDCAVIDGPEGGKFVFPSKDGIIWVNRVGYKNSDNMANFTHRPPVLFPTAKDADEAKAQYEAMDWEAERKEVDAIFTDMLADYKETFGGYGGFAAVAGILQYPAHPEVRPQIGGKPGLWVQGEKGSGKTKTVEYGMRAMGYPLNYGYISLGGTKVGVERSLCQFSNLPFHIDEWRNENADAKLEDLLRNCYNETATPKGTPNGSKAVRKLVPSTIPVVTGEDGTTDSALRSRYMRLIASKSYDETEEEYDSTDASQAKRKRDELEIQKRRDDRYFRIMERSENYHRIGRYIFKHRVEFSAMVVQFTKDFAANTKVMESIKDSRARQVFGVFYATLLATQIILSKNQRAFDFPHTKGSENVRILQWFIKHGSESAEETERDVFRRRFFAECVTMIERGNVQHVERYLRVRRGFMGDDGKLKLHSQINDDGGRLYVMVAYNELFAEYTADKRKRGENVPIAQTNIQAELRQQAGWINATTKDRKHRLGIPGESKSHRTWWVLDYKKLEPELRSILQTIYERELDAVDMDLAEDGFTPARRPSKEA